MRRRVECVEIGQKFVKCCQNSLVFMDRHSSEGAYHIEHSELDRLATMRWSRPVAAQHPSPMRSGSEGGEAVWHDSPALARWSGCFTAPLSSWMPLFGTFFALE